MFSDGLVVEGRQDSMGLHQTLIISVWKFNHSSRVQDTEGYGIQTFTHLKNLVISQWAC